MDVITSLYSAKPLQGGEIMNGHCIVPGEAAGVLISSIVMDRVGRRF